MSSRSPAPFPRFEVPSCAFFIMQCFFQRETTPGVLSLPVSITWLQTVSLTAEGKRQNCRESEEWRWSMVSSRLGWVHTCLFLSPGCQVQVEPAIGKLGIWLWFCLSSHWYYPWRVTFFYLISSHLFLFDGEEEGPGGDLGWIQWLYSICTLYLFGGFENYWYPSPTYSAFCARSGLERGTSR